MALLAGCAVMPSGPVPNGEATLYVVERGWHTDIGLPVDEVRGQLASLDHEFPGVRFMVFGFGERRYYMAHTAGSAEMLAALFPSTSAILLTALLVPPTEAFADERVIVIHLSQADIDRIASRIWQSFELHPDGSAIRLADGPYLGSVFYAGTETYDAFYTCNTWTAQVLREGGLPMTSNGVLFADQVMEQVMAIATQQARDR